MAWIYLIIASVAEIVWALALKFTHGFQSIAPVIIVVIGLIISFYCLAVAVRSIPIGTAYAIWTGVGAAGTALLGMVLFDESAAFFRVLSLVAIISGVVGLKLFLTVSESEEQKKPEDVL
ncbi:Quaternary ammonium compound-resistance protein SugE [Piscirickettsia salmonis]|uniref:Guanidinium exporter n=1 Tax=Piscirickettsia salmonis TaxID=1238 RepID=A0A1L6TDI3_PISSA|nr:multidrug efflux SMR transporter [Piscirickettsia salmonis]AKP74515.1 multidrug transporter [Piscirickettsia salmonis LF-89 = ATCC VR-1361]ALB23484.1 quaternary ammonium compound-resistance protein SugE [Piscirickettsia salmonis]ALY03362.1 multidrug transporter [Piscirickettsia salmonis]AMA42928.1 multidrug transporter [Piscirickettsia salmonis]AOS35396.1 multidrug transporter [Piscirickettsia salmonis]